MKNYMLKKLRDHLGHNIVCVAYGNDETTADICIECADCNEVLLSAEDFDCEEAILVATDILWDVDVDEEDNVELPTEIEIPFGMTDLDEIGDYISNLVGFCHSGFSIEAKYVKEKENTDMYKTFLYNAIISWYDDAFTEYQGLDDPMFVERVCAKVGLSEEQYKEIMNMK